MTAFADSRSSTRRPTRDGALPRLLRAGADIIQMVVLWPVRMHANRQLLERMSVMSDYELSDIGLTRGDLADSTALPLNSEIGSFLAKRASERRRR